MGACTCILYAAVDPSISGMVLDSPFSSLTKLMGELAQSGRVAFKVPTFLVPPMISVLRSAIDQRANFDIDRLELVEVVQMLSMPCLFAHASDDDFVDASHSRRLHANCASPCKCFVPFEGSHNSPRPQAFHGAAASFVRRLFPDQYAQRVRTRQIVAPRAVRSVSIGAAVGVLGCVRAERVRAPLRSCPSAREC